MLINVKMPTNVAILTIISMINKISESLKARKVLYDKNFITFKTHTQKARARGYKSLFMLNSTEHEISTVRKN